MASIDVIFSFKGQTHTVSNVIETTTIGYLIQCVRESFQLMDNETTSYTIKLLCKGKVLTKNNTGVDMEDTTSISAFPSVWSMLSNTKKHTKIIVMATPTKKVQELNAGRSDPTIRGFDNNKDINKTDNHGKSKTNEWGNTSTQDKNYKFCRFQACTWQQFGHRASNQDTPHAFAAMALLEKLACDPGIVAIMVERELVVGTLGEMDPIDDRIKHKTEAKGGCLLGYNTNGGTRIDLKLRPDNLQGFLPYRQIVSTLIHELSHNWVGEHNALFWSNYAQMRVEYIHTHVSLATSGYIINGKPTLEIADIPQLSSLVVGRTQVESTNNNATTTMRSIAEFVIAECGSEMKNYGIPVEVVTPLILDRCRELTTDSHQSEQGRKLGTTTTVTGSTTTSRELALAAAERRLRQNKQPQKQKKDKDDDHMDR